MSTIRKHSGMIGWGIVGGTILAVEILSPETLSTASDRMLRGEYGKATRLAWQIGAGILFAHTMNLLPKSIDPIQQFGDKVLSHTGVERLSIGHASTV